MARHSESGLFVANPPSREERKALLVDCPAVRRQGAARALLLTHLRTDHGLSDFDILIALKVK